MEREQRQRGAPDAPVIVDDHVGLRTIYTRSLCLDGQDAQLASSPHPPTPAPRPSDVAIVDIGGVGQGDLQLSREGSERNAEALQ